MPSLDSHAPHSPSPSSSSIDFESGKVLSQMPFEYSSFLDLPPSSFGKTTPTVYIHTQQLVPIVCTVKKLIEILVAVLRLPNLKKMIGIRKFESDVHCCYVVCIQ